MEISTYIVSGEFSDQGNGLRGRIKEYGGFAVSGMVYDPAERDSLSPSLASTDNNSSVSVVAELAPVPEELAAANC